MYLQMYPSKCTCKFLILNVLAGKKTTQRLDQGVEVSSMCLRNLDIKHPCILLHSSSTFMCTVPERDQLQNFCTFALNLAKFFVWTFSKQIWVIANLKSATNITWQVYWMRNRGLLLTFLYHTHHPNDVTSHRRHHLKNSWLHYRPTASSSLQSRVCNSVSISTKASYPISTEVRFPPRRSPSPRVWRGQRRQCRDGRAGRRWQLLGVQRPQLSPWPWALQL